MSDGFDFPRDQFIASMALLQNRGFLPATFIDLGAAEARFFLGRRELGLFPQARHFFIDAMRENEEVYRRLGAKFGTGYEIAAVSASEGSASLQIDPDFYDTHVDGAQGGRAYKERRSVPMTTLDSLVARHALRPPFALKLDVQGGELQALRGATRVLQETLFVTAEIRLYGQPDTFAELLAFLQDAGWRLFDVTDLGHTLADQMLIELYATFIPARLEFRDALPYGDPGQMAQLGALLRQRRRANLEAVDELVRNA